MQTFVTILRACACLAFLGGAATPLQAQTEAATFDPPNSLVIPRLENWQDPVTVDGELGEGRWRQAAVIPSFNSVWGKNEQAIQQSSARIFYDTENLYIGLVFNEEKMASIIHGIPAGQAEDAPVNSNDDCCEILIAPEGDPHRYFVLKFTPSGARFDAQASSDIARGGRFQFQDDWNGDWSIATALGAESWSAEVRVPLDLFAREGEFVGVPVAGQSWRLNICRVASTSGEFSAWNKSPKGFQVPESFGEIVFRGWEHGEIVLEGVSPGEMIVGSNTFTGTIRNASDRDASVKLQAVLSRKITDPEELTETEKQRAWEIPRRLVPLHEESLSLAPGATREVRFVYTLHDGGLKTVGVQLTWERMKMNIYSGSAYRNVYPLLETNQRHRRQLEDLRKRAAATGTLTGRYRPLADGFAAGLRAAEGELAALMASAEQWDARVAASQQLDERLEALERTFANELVPAYWAVTRGREELAFCVGSIHPTEKVFRDDLFRGSIGEEVAIAMAANEYESAQFVILYLDKMAGEIAFSATELVSEDNPEDMIPVSNLEFQVVGYIDIGDTGKGTRVGAWPDVLYPETRVAYNGYPLQPVMLTVKTDKAQVAGLYKGSVSFTGSDGQAIVIQLQVRVYPFALPDQKSLRSSFWFSTYRPRNYYGGKLGGEFFPVSLYTEFAEILGRYQMAPSPRGDILSRMIRLKRNADGSIGFDFSRIDPYWEASLASGANVLYIDSLPSSFFLEPEKNWIPRAILVDPVSGAESDYVAEDPEQMAAAYIRAVVDHFKERGWFDRAVIQVSDEPWGSTKQQQIRDAVTRLRLLAPDLPVVSAGTVRGKMNLDGYIDIWCPQFRQYNPDDYADMKEGEKLWLYQCLYKPFFPTYTIDRPGIDPRIAAWICWKTGAEGFLYWTATMWDSPAIIKQKMAGDNRWIKEQWLFPWDDMPGDGCFIYPEKERLVASFRAQAIRDGFEDYEYLVQLDSHYRAAVAGGKLPPELRQRAETLLAIPDPIVKSCMSWTKSPGDLEATRRAIAETIVELQEGRR